MQDKPKYSRVSDILDLAILCYQSCKGTSTKVSAEFYINEVKQ